MDLPDYAIEAEGLVKTYPATKTTPEMRALKGLDLKIPRTFLLPESDGPLPGTEALTEAGVSVVPIPDCGHNIMLDNPDAFVAATAAALAPQD